MANPYCSTSPLVKQIETISTSVYKESLASSLLEAPTAERDDHTILPSLSIGQVAFPIHRSVKWSIGVRILKLS